MPAIIEPGQPPTAPPTAPPPAAAPPAAAPPASNPYDFSTDPILQRIVAYDTSARANAQAAADAARRQLAIQFGDASGFTGDKATGDAAANNPFSVLANLKRGYDQETKQHEEALNNANLFYSGARVNQLQRDATGYQQQQYNARQQALAQLSGVQNQLAAALSGADQSDMQGLQDAYGRAQQQALTYGYDPGAGATPGHPSLPHLPHPTVAHALVHAVPITANPTGGSWRPHGGIFAIH